MTQPLIKPRGYKYAGGHFISSNFCIGLQPHPSSHSEMWARKGKKEAGPTANILPRSIQKEVKTLSVD